VWFQERPVQPRLRVVCEAHGAAGDADEARLAEDVARRLAALGLRIDRVATPGTADGGPALLAARSAEGTEVRVRLGQGGTDPGPAGGWIPLRELSAADLGPLLEAIGADPADCVPFDPDGQEPPPAVPAPPGFGPGSGSHAADPG
jgi:hypothetical protein